MGSMNSYRAGSEPRLLSGRYRVEGLLGEGASAVVWKALDQTTGSTVAVKELKRRVDGSFAHSAVRFAAEASILRQLDDPNVVSVLDVGEDEAGTPFFVMEYLGSETLATLLARDSRLSPEATLALLLPVGRALERLHARGIIHRDFKPQNVAIVHVDGALTGKILDFGIAKTGGLTLTISGTTLGTPAYMAPEQALGTEVGPPCDIWSFGVVLYECLSGATPFTAESPAALLLKLVTGQASPLEERCPDVSRSLALAVDKALRARPALRYPNMGSFLAALELTRDHLDQAGSPLSTAPSPPTATNPALANTTVLTVPAAFEMKGVGLVNVRGYVLEHHGTDAWQRVLRGLAPADAEVAGHALPVGWYRVSTFAALLRSIDRECGRGDLGLLPAVGAFEADQDFNRVLRIFLRIVHPSYVFNISGRLWQHFQNSGVWVIERSDHAMLASLQGWAVDAALCAEMTGYLVRLFEFAGGNEVTCQHVRCRARGHEHCDYDIRWR
jgi:tRNA A-37 threonylcarbamoyl transferase component Bud32